MAIPLALIGMSYALSIKNDLTWGLNVSTKDNPNRPAGYFERDLTLVSLRKKAWPDNPIYPVTDPGPSWKKWDSEED